MYNKKYLKIGSVLLILMLTSVVGISAASAASVNHNISVTISDNALVLTNDVPSYIQMPDGSWVLSGSVGNFVPAKSVYGALRTAYAYEITDNNGSIITTLDVDYANNTISQIGGHSANSTHIWTAFKGNTRVTDLSTAVNSGENVTFFLIPTNYNSSIYSIQNSKAVQAYKISITCSNVNTIFNGTVNYSANMTGVSALQAASDNNTTFTYNITYPYGNAWLNHINNISPNYTKTGYGWGLLLNNNWTYSLDTVNPVTGDVLQIWMLPSADAGNFNGTVIGANASAYSAGYYADGITDEVTITIV